MLQMTVPWHLPSEFGLAAVQCTTMRLGMTQSKFGLTAVWHMTVRLGHDTVVNRHWLEGTREPIHIITDHWNLEYFKNLHPLNCRQLHWLEQLTHYNYKIFYWPGGKNSVADAVTIYANFPLFLRIYYKFLQISGGGRRIPASGEDKHILVSLRMTWRRRTDQDSPYQPPTERTPIRWPEHETVSLWAS